MSLSDIRRKEIKNTLHEILKSNVNFSTFRHNGLSGNKHFEALKKRKPDELKPFIIELIIYIEQKESNFSVGVVVLEALLRKNLGYNEEEWKKLLNTFKNCLLKYQENSRNSKNLPIHYTVKQIEKYMAKSEPSNSLTAFISDVVSWKILDQPHQNFRKALALLQTLTGSEPRFKLLTNDIGNQVNALIADSKFADIDEMHRILNLANSANTGKPTQKFIKDCSQSIDTIGRDNYRCFAHDFLTVIIEKPLEKCENQWGYTETMYLCDASKQFTKGMVWTMVNFSDKQTVDLLSQLLEKAYTKIPGIGPMASAIGNACAYTLGNMRGKDGLGALSRLKLKLKQNNIKKVIDGYLTEGAKKYGVSVEELKEMAVPDFHLQSGRKVVDFADYQLTIAIEDSKVTKTWTNPDGKTMKSVPSVVKNEAKLTQKLKDVRKTVKDIQKTYSAQKQRIDNQFILAREWDFASFDKYYLSHGLVAPIATRLIWSFTDGKRSANAMWLDGVWQDATGETIEWIGETCTVSLWHPVFATETDIVAWRDRIMAIECKQPIKQAFRELYVLTDAEIKTKSYSNRMASHILKQHQFKTLAVLRDWKYSLLGAYDDGRDNETCEKFLPEHHLTAEFWIDELANYDDEYWNDAGIWYYISTDQVKFKNTEGSTLDLVDVPKIVFSEIMRDVDLFVGVCSVGNDPEWQDQNGERQQRDYWQSYSFGDLGEVAKTRKAVLERLLPRLTKLKGKASIDGKFLIVEGKIRTYKIHIGSGNILMEPNDQYLCIVPARNTDKTTDKLFIPFEGDNGLSIVLSKALMLAEDTKIKDETIISQIKGE